MSAIAGRVLLIPKGNYDSTATYTMLDMVVYNGSSYICKQECTGVVPTNTTYWMLNASGSAVAYINDIGDVVITNPTNGQVLMYDSTTQKWVNGTITTTLAGLTDTQIASLQNGQVLKYNATSQKWENAEDTGGILPHLIVISETGSTVTATKGTTVITATETSTGHFECDLPEFGTWTIDAILGGDDAQVSLVVDTVKVYTVDDSHFHATVTVKYPSGATCNLAGQGESYYATGSPYTFTVHHAGQYTITVVYDGQTYTETVTVTTTGETISEVVPSPSSAPANDINFWLLFGGVSGTFSTLEEILANSTALSLLMASTDAVDYLVRCKEWINNKVPIMTSNNTPKGQCFGKGGENSSTYAYWKAFDNDNSTYWLPATNSLTEYYYEIGYEYDVPIKANKLHLQVALDTGITSEINVLGSNNGTDYTLLGTIPITQNVTNEDFTNQNTYKYYKINFKNPTHYGSSTGNVSVYSLQFYTDDICNNQSAMSYIGLNNYCANTLLADADWLDGICNSEYFESVLNVKVPTMTSNTTPSGVASASTASENAWKVFDDSDSTYWVSDNVTTNQWVQYKFPSNCKVYKFTLKPRAGSSVGTRVKNFNILSSDDDFSTSNTEFTGVGYSDGSIFTGIINTPNSADSWRLHIIDTYSSYPSVLTLQFYGRADV